MIIRKEQMEAFDRDSILRFENELVAHLKKFAPAHSESLGDAVLRPLVQLGRQRAEQYGFTNRGPVRFYIELMIRLGTNFDSDPQYPWATRLLQDKMNPDQNASADQLYNAAMFYIDTVIGPNEEFEKEALHKASLLRLDLVPALGATFEAKILWQLNTVYPQKYHVVGETALRDLIRAGIEEAAKQSLQTDAGASLLIALMFGFGHECVRDPQFPWVQSALAGNGTPSEKVERLFKHFRSYVRLGLAYLEQR